MPRRRTSGRCPGLGRLACAATDPVGTLAAELQYDPQKIFRYVADKIRYEPYDGILRGAAGTRSRRRPATPPTRRCSSPPCSRTARSRIASRADRSTRQRPPRIVGDAGDRSRDTPGSSPGRRCTQGLDERRRSRHARRLGERAAGRALRQQAQTVAAAATKRLDHAKSRLGDTVKTIEDALSGAGVQLPRGDRRDAAAERADGPHLGADGERRRVGGSRSHPGRSAAWRRADEAARRCTSCRTTSATRSSSTSSWSACRAASWSPTTPSPYTDFADQLAGTPVTFGHTTPSGLAEPGRGHQQPARRRLARLPTDPRGRRPVVHRRRGRRVSRSQTVVAGSSARNRHRAAGPLDGEATAEWLQVQVTPPGGQAGDRAADDLRSPSGGSARCRAADAERSRAASSWSTSRAPGSIDFLPMLGLEEVRRRDRHRPVHGRGYDRRCARQVRACLPRPARRHRRPGGARRRRSHVRRRAEHRLRSRSMPNGDPQAPKAEVGLDIWHRSHGVLPLTGSTLSAAQSRLVAGVTDHVAERFAVDGLADTSGVRQRQRSG